MGEVHRDTRINGEALVVAHLLALVVREGLLEFSGYGLERSRVRFAYRHGVFLRSHRDEECVAGRTLDQGTKRCPLVLPEDEVALPVTGDGAVGDLLRPLLNGEHICYRSSLLLGVLPALPAICMFVPERFDERLLEGASREYVDEAVYGFVRYAHVHVERILCFEASLYLSR